MEIAGTGISRATRTLELPPGSIGTLIFSPLDRLFTREPPTGKLWEDSPTPTESEQPINWEYARAFILSYLRRRLDGVDPSDIQDVTQEAMVRLIRVSRTAQIRNLEALMLKIARRCSVDFFRKRQRWQVMSEPIEVHIESVADPRSDPPSRLGDPKERIEFIVLEFFHGRSEICWSLAMAFFEGRSWTSVARALSKSPEAIRKQWERCRLMLRKAIDEDGGGLLGFDVAE
jgi:DNA-directed RNA polymerase specialized sigma24 family protein